MSSADPGGGTTGAPPNMSNIQENFSQQQAKISALKELVKNTELNKNTASDHHEKVKNIAQRLTHLKSKALKSRQSGSDSRFDDKEFSAPVQSVDTGSSTSSSMMEERQFSMPASKILRAKSETPGSEKIQLLRQQMEQNRQKMAEREHSNKGIEKMVTQLKAKLDVTQMSLEKSSELGKSIGDLSTIGGKGGLIAKSTTDLSYNAINFDKDRIRTLKRKIVELESKLKEKENVVQESSQTEQAKKIKVLESKILDLEENLKEKECVIDARTQAVSLMSENLSLKGKNTVELLEETKQEMVKMQRNFIKAENDYQSDIEVLKIELDEKCGLIENFEEKIKILENSRFELTMKNSELEGKLNDVNDYSTKLSELTKLNDTLQRRINDLENQKFDIITDDEIAAARSGDQAMATTEVDNRIEEMTQEINNLNQKLRLNDVSDSEIVKKCLELERDVETYQKEISDLKGKLEAIDESLAEKTIEYNVLQANFTVLEETLTQSTPKPLFSKSTDEEAELEITKLKSQLDESNKGSIKMKLKMKQLQKQIDNLKKSSSIHEDLVKLTEENQVLHHKIIELEEEKGQLQLKLVDDGSRVSSTPEETNNDDKIKILEQTCQNQTSAIQLLEEQKIEMTDDLQTTKEELESLKDQIKEIDQQQTTRVSCQYTEIEFEEKMEQYKSEIAELCSANKDLKSDLDKLETEKNRYLSENTELLEKIDKLSVGKGSSNESIEILANLTQQEKQEIEEFNKKHENPEENLDINESLVKLREESSELMHKIDLFTTERKEVLEKMEMLTHENAHLKHEMELLEKEKSELMEKLQGIKVIEVREIVEVEEKFEVVNKKFEDQGDIPIITTTTVTESNQSSSSSSLSTSLSVVNAESYTKSLKNLENEIEAFKRNKDKNTKFKQFKKFVQEAQRVHDLLNELLESHQTATLQNQRLEDEVNALKQNIQSLDGQQQELEQLRKELLQKENSSKNENDLQLQIENLRATTEEKTAQLLKLTTELNEIKSNQSLNDDRERDLKSTIDDLTNQLLTFKTETTANIASKADEYTKTINTKDAEIENYKHENDQINQQLIESQRAVVNLQTELEIRLKSSEDQMDILKLLVAEQKQQLIDTYTEHEKEMASKMEEIGMYEKRIDKLKKELMANSQNNDVVENLRTMLDKQEEDLHYKQQTIDTLNNQIIELYRTMEDNTNQFIIRQDELQEIVDQKTEASVELNVRIANNDKEIEQLQKKLKQKSNELEKMSLSAKDDSSNQFKQLETALAEMENKNKEQLDKLKKFAANLKKKAAQCLELEQKLASHEAGSPETIIKLNELKNEKEHLQTQFNDKSQLCAQLEQEIGILKSELNRTNANLQQSIDSHDVTSQLYEQIGQLTNESAHYSQLVTTLQNQMQTLKSQHEAEIAKRDNSLDILESEVDKLNNLLTEKDNGLELKQNELNAVNEKLKEINSLQEDLKSKNLKIEKCKTMIKEKLKEINRLNNNCDELKQEIELLNQRLEKQSQDNDSSEKIRLQQLSAKVEENMLYIETVETENIELKAKIEKLEDGDRVVEEEKLAMEEQFSMLSQELQNKNLQFTQNEEMLVQKLSTITENNELMEKRVKELQHENKELSNALQESKHKNDEINKKVQHQQSHIDFMEQDKLPEIEKENQTLSNSLEVLKAEVKRIHHEFENKLHEKSREFDDVELNYEQQIECMRKDNRNIDEQLEKVRDESSYLKDEVVQLKDSIHLLEQLKTDLERELTWTKLQNENLSHDQIDAQELRMQIVQDQTEIENLRLQNQTILQNHEIEVTDLKKQLTELDSMNLQVGQNQTDDQVMLQHENTKLRDLLHEKEMEIEQYHQQRNIQFPSTSAAPTHEYNSNSDDQNLRELELETSLRDKDVEINILRMEISELQRNVLRQSSQQEIDAVVTVAEEHVRALQQNINTESIAVLRQKYEADTAALEHQVTELQTKCASLEAHTLELEEKFKNLHILREESLRQLASKTKITDEVMDNYREAERKIQELEDHVKSFAIKNVEPHVESKPPAKETAPSFDMFFGGQPDAISHFDEHVAVDVNASRVESSAPVQRNVPLFDMFFGGHAAGPSPFDEALVLAQPGVSDSNDANNALREEYEKLLKEFNDIKPDYERVREANQNLLSEITLRTNVAVQQDEIIRQHVNDRENLSHQLQELKSMYDQVAAQNQHLQSELDILKNYRAENEILLQIQANERENLIVELNQIKTKQEHILAEKQKLASEVQALKESASFDRDTVDNRRSSDTFERLTHNPVSKLFESSTKNLFGGSTDDDDYKNKSIVEESVIAPSKTYVCGPEVEKLAPPPASMEILFDDQSWGWEADQPQSLEHISVETSSQNQSGTSSAGGYHIDYDKIIENLHQENRALRDHLDVLKLKLDDNITSIDQQKKLLEDEIIAIRKENTRLETNLCDLQIRIEELLSAKENIEVVCEEQKTHIEHLKVDNDNFRVKIAEIEKVERDSSHVAAVLPSIIADTAGESVIIPSFNSSTFFGQGGDDFVVQSPIVEEVCVQKKAYVCGTEQEDDGWGWGSNEAMLEEQHQKSTVTQNESLVPPDLQSQIQMQNYEDKIQELELEKSRLGDEVIALKVKSGKMIKKLNEYKNEKALKRASSLEVSSDLDMAIQEELNSQVKNLEVKLKETKGDLVKSEQEKQNLVKRIDVLTSANERMTDMKERQDNEVEMYTFKIRDLTLKLQQMEEWGDENYNKESPLKTAKDPENSSAYNVEDLQNQIKTMTTEINDLRIDNDELQAILDEERENNKLYETKLKKIDELNVQIERLKEDLDKANIITQGKVDENNNLQSEVQHLKESNTVLANEIERMKTASLFQSPEFTAATSNPFNTLPVQNDFEKISELEQENQNLSGQIHYKNLEIQQLNKKIEDILKEDQTESLVQEILTKNHEINLLKTQVQQLQIDKDELENNLSLQLTQVETVNLRKEIDGKNATVQLLEQKLNEILTEKCDMEKELKILNDQVIESLTYDDKLRAAALELDVKNIEISELRNTLAGIQPNSAEQHQPSNDDSATQHQLYDLENKWKQYVLDRESQFNSVIESMTQEIDQLKQQSMPEEVSHSSIEPISSPIDNQATHYTADAIQKMENALENQELEIVTLKEQLAIRCAEYARLASQLDPFAQMSSSTYVPPKQVKKTTSERKTSSADSIASESSDVVPRGELDLALYMLHQRDMRCEELTLELVHLLEERDTLQLKLSNSIRQIEDSKRKSGLSDISDSEYDDINILKPEETTQPLQGQSLKSSDSNYPHIIETSSLKSKLTQLHAVSNSRDKTLQEDRESRQRQFDQLQRDISNIPSEAVSQIVGADYTLSRTSQSPSTVLFNWLMGKGTPRAPQQQ